jgi:hypothetical protein
MGATNVLGKANLMKDAKYYEYNEYVSSGTVVGSINISALTIESAK